MKASKKRTTTQKMGKSNGRSKKTNGSVRRLNKSQMKGMAGGLNFSELGAFATKELFTYGPSVINDFFKFISTRRLK
jgi:hypothetical protein